MFAESAKPSQFTFTLLKSMRRYVTNFPFNENCEAVRQKKSYKIGRYFGKSFLAHLSHYLSTTWQSFVEGTQSCTHQLFVRGGWEKSSLIFSLTFFSLTLWSLSFSIKFPVKVSCRISEIFPVISPSSLYISSITYNTGQSATCTAVYPLP